MTETREKRPDFLVIGPAVPPDPHIELKLLDMTVDVGPWSRDESRRPRRGPVFVGDEGAILLPSIPANDRGLHLWSEPMVARLREVIADPPVDVVEAEIRILGRPGLLPERYFVVVPHVVHTDVIDREASARLSSTRGETRGSRAEGLDRIVLRPDFAPTEAVFGLDFLGSAGLALHPDFESRFVGRVNLWHSWVSRISEIRLGHHPANELPTPWENHAEMVRGRIEALSSPPEPKPRPPRPADMEEARALCLARVRARGGLTLSGNRESWSRLVVRDGELFHESGDVGDGRVHVRDLGEEEAWSMIRDRVFEDMGLWRREERAVVTPEALVTRLYDMRP